MTVSDNHGLDRFQRSKLSEDRYDALVRPFLAVGADVPPWQSAPA